MVCVIGVLWMLGVGCFGSILGFFVGGVLLLMGWGFGVVIVIFVVLVMLVVLIIVFI